MSLVAGTGGRTCTAGAGIEPRRRAAERQSRNLTANIQARLRPRLDALADDPRPLGVERLSGSEILYRIRVGDYCVINAIDEEKLIGLVVRLGHRRDI